MTVFSLAMRLVRDRPLKEISRWRTSPAISARWAISFSAVAVQAA
jgi:hypothetical protein